MNLFYRIIRTIVYIPFLTFWPTKVVHKERFDAVEGGAVCICNHYSMADTLIPAVRLYKKELHVLAKAEAFETRIGNWFLSGCGAIPVHRGQPDMHAYKSILSLLKQDKKFVIYPEGTRNKEGTAVMKEFKDGAALFAIRSEKPIIPMLYYRKHKLFHFNYLYIGEPIHLDQFFGEKKISAVIDDAVKIVYDRMCELRVELDDYVLQKKGHAYVKKHRDHDGGVL